MCQSRRSRDRLLKRINAVLLLSFIIPSLTYLGSFTHYYFLTIYIERDTLVYEDLL